MIATVSVAEVGARTLVGALRRRPQPERVAGLRWADAAVLAALAATRPPSLRRVAMLAFWDDAEAASRFRRDDPLARPFAGGFHATLRLVRAVGSWPGVPPELATGRPDPHDGAVMVLTLADVRLPETPRFLRTSRPAEKAALAADGFLWGTASARPPFAATISVWRDGASAAAYAHGRRQPEHRAAIAEQQRRDFHHRSAFLRFAPLEVEGALTGADPLSAATFAA